jgi:hypothetical protein
MPPLSIAIWIVSLFVGLLLLFCFVISLLLLLPRLTQQYGFTPFKGKNQAETFQKIQKQNVVSFPPHPRGKDHEVSKTLYEMTFDCFFFGLLCF